MLRVTRTRPCSRAVAAIIPSVTPRGRPAPFERSAVPRRSSPVVTTLRNWDSFVWRSSHAATLPSGRGRRVSDGMFVSRRNSLTTNRLGARLKGYAGRYCRFPRSSISPEQVRTVPSDFQRKGLPGEPRADGRPLPANPRQPPRLRAPARWPAAQAPLALRD
jgi:hypothetical protein